jgi:hypothetical protein
LCRLHAHQPTVLQKPATPRLAFLQQLPVKDMELLEAAISSGHNLDRILIFLDLMTKIAGLIHPLTH